MNRKRRILIISCVFFITACLCCPSSSSVVQSNLQNPTTTIKIQPTHQTPTARFIQNPTVSINIHPTIEFLPLAGHILADVKVYYGELRTYGFKIIGYANDCSSIGCERCIRVMYPEGNTEWKDRDYFN